MSGPHGSISAEGEGAGKFATAWRGSADCGAHRCAATHETSEIQPRPHWVLFSFSSAVLYDAASCPPTTPS